MVAADHLSILWRLKNRSFELEEAEELTLVSSYTASVVLDNLRIERYYVFHYNELEELGGIMYELQQIGANSYYIQSPAKIGIFRLREIYFGRAVERTL